MNAWFEIDNRLGLPPAGALGRLASRLGLSAEQWQVAVWAGLCGLRESGASYARASFDGATGRNAYIYPACFCEEGLSALAIMESALLLLIRSSASFGPPRPGFEEAALTGCAIVGVPDSLLS